MRTRIRSSFSCLLLLSLPLFIFFFLSLTPCSGSESLEADPEAAKVAPVEEDKSVDVTPHAPTPLSTTSAPPATTTNASPEQTQTEDPDTVSPDSTTDTNTPTPDFETTKFKFEPLTEDRSSPDDDGYPVTSSVSPSPPSESLVTNQTRIPDDAVNNSTTPSFNTSTTISIVKSSELPSTRIDQVTEKRSDEVTAETTTPTSGDLLVSSTTASSDSESSSTTEQSSVTPNTSPNDTTTISLTSVSEDQYSANTTTQLDMSETSSTGSLNLTSGDNGNALQSNETFSTIEGRNSPSSVSTTSMTSEANATSSNTSVGIVSQTSQTTALNFSTTAPELNATTTIEQSSASVSENVIVTDAESLNDTSTPQSGVLTSESTSNSSSPDSPSSASSESVAPVAESSPSTPLVSASMTPVLITSTTPIPEPDPWQDFNIESCSLPHSRGPCKNDDMMWWYDHKDGVCKAFYYSGCGGNNNRFTSRKDCEMKCWNSQDICKLNRVRGPCTGSFVQWFYDAAIDQCTPFSYSGCLGNANRFSQKESCETQCKINNPPASVIPFPTPAIVDYPSSISIPTGQVPHFHSSNGVVSCLDTVDPGKCHDYVIQYYYDANENMCRNFVYTGCGGNGNRFTSRSQCESKCVHLGREEPLSLVDKDIVCRLGADVGNGIETHARWVYDPNSSTCLPFVYTGSGGNKNRFKSFEICLKFCRNHLTIMSPFPPSVDTQSTEEAEESRNRPSDRLPDPFPLPEMTLSSTTTPLSTTTQKDICKYECMDSPFFADCHLIVLRQFCGNPYYAKFCCKSCLQNNQLDVEKVKEVIIGPDSSNYNVLNDGSRICLFENTHT